MNVARDYKPKLPAQQLAILGEPKMICSIPLSIIYIVPFVQARTPAAPCPSSVLSYVLGEASHRRVSWDIATLLILFRHLAQRLPYGTCERTCRNE